MSLVNFDYYQNDYLGRTIPTEAEFDNLAIKSSAYVNRITSGRASQNSELEAVKNAVCAVAEVQYLQAQDEKPSVTSETVGNHSVGYGSRAARTTSDREKEKYRAAALFLSMTGMLYGGLR